MAENPSDQVVQLRLLSVGLVLGGVLLGVLSLVGPVLLIGAALVGVGTVVWFEEERRGRIAGVGMGVGLVGIVAVLAAVLALGFHPLELAFFAVAAGVLDYLLAPTLGRAQESGENAGGR